MKRTIISAVFLSIGGLGFLLESQLAIAEPVDPTWEEYLASGGIPACYQGPCDDPVARDNSIPAPNDVITYIRTHVTVFCNTVGTLCSVSEANLNAQIAATNSYLLPLRMRLLIVNIDTVYAESYYYNPNYALLRSNNAVNPSQQLNIYVTTTSQASRKVSQGTFPWDVNRPPLSNLGGIILVNHEIYPSYEGSDVLAHELGHTLGLYHTFVGASCALCHENPDGSNGDVAGDLCSDTPAENVWQDCVLHTDVLDICTSTLWPPADLGNFMRITYESGCLDHFTPQQWGRMHCWFDDVLSSWGGECQVDLTGDVNVSGAVTSPDISYLTSYVFQSGPEPLPCPASGDVNCSAAVTVGDVIYLNNYVWYSGAAPCNVCLPVINGIWECD